MGIAEPSDAFSFTGHEGVMGQSFLECLPDQPGVWSTLSAQLREALERANDSSHEFCRNMLGFGYDLAVDLAWLAKLPASILFRLLREFYVNKRRFWIMYYTIRFVMLMYLGVLLQSAFMHHFKLWVYPYYVRAFGADRAAEIFVTHCKPYRHLRGLLNVCWRKTYSWYLSIQPRPYTPGSRRPEAPDPIYDDDAAQEGWGEHPELNIEHLDTQEIHTGLPNYDAIALPTAPRPRIPISLNFNPITQAIIDARADVAVRSIDHPANMEIANEVSRMFPTSQMPDILRPAFYPGAGTHLRPVVPPAAAAAQASLDGGSDAGSEDLAEQVVEQEMEEPRRPPPMGRLAGPITTHAREYWTAIDADMSGCVLSCYCELPGFYQAMIEESITECQDLAADWYGPRKAIHDAAMRGVARISDLIGGDPTYRFQIDRRCENVLFLVHYCWQSRANLDTDYRMDTRAIGWRNSPIDADPYLIMVERQIEVVQVREVKSHYTRGEMNCLGVIPLPAMCASLTVALNVGFHSRGSGRDHIEEHLLRITAMQTVNAPVDGEWVQGTKEIAYAIAHDEGLSGVYAKCRNFDVVSAYAPARAAPRARM